MQTESLQCEIEKQFDQKPATYNEEHFHLFARFKQALNEGALRSAEPDDFVLVETIEQEIEVLKTRCSVLSEILFWKTFYLRVAFTIAIVSIVVAIGLLIYTRLWPR